jgi:hypothetical protein
MKPDKKGILGLFYREKHIVLRYPDANIIDCVEFLEILGKNDFALIEYLYNFLNDFGQKKIDKKTFKKYYVHNLGKVLALLRKSRFKGLFDTEGGESIEESEENNVDFETIIEEFKESLSKSIAFLSGKMGIDPKNIQKNYSFREFKYWEEYYYYIERLKTEEGQKENEKMDTAKRVKREKHIYEAGFEKLEKYLSSKKK